MAPPQARPRVDGLCALVRPEAAVLLSARPGPAPGAVEMRLVERGAGGAARDWGGGGGGRPLSMALRSPESGEMLPKSEDTLTAS